MTARAVNRAIVVPTIGRASLTRLLAALSGERVIVVDDRADDRETLPVPMETHVISGPRRGAAAARNRGWRAIAAEWIVFLDDDAEPTRGWRDALEGDLATNAGAVQGCLGEPLVAHRRVAGQEGRFPVSETVDWSPADLACRRAALAAVGGFDERLPRGQAEGADLALHVVAAGFRIEGGWRRTLHPVGAPSNALAGQPGRNTDAAPSRTRRGRLWR